MSRIGNRPIKINEGIFVSVDSNDVKVKSDKGQLNFVLPKGISADIEDDQILVKKTSDDKNTRSLHGLSARIIGNMINDSKDGVKKILDFKGTGYRAKVENNAIVLNMGYSHAIYLQIPNEININIVKNKITVEGIDRNIVGQFAASIRAVRPPEVYKGKGIRYDTEFIKKKAGKAAQTTTGKA